MTLIKTAIDTNILAYLHEAIAILKKEKAEIILSSRPIIPSQVFVEYLNFVRKSFKEKTKTEIISNALELVKYCQITSLSDTTFIKALSLIQKYDFQLFDSIIVASAIEADCEILYTEDMQHNLMVENSLTIINPFL
ncbi:MAG: PIN domain-containing protein [Bacteroidota bacterium]|nr:PIN domain-containing protein [Bacteroidota bacterium]